MDNQIPSFLALGLFTAALAAVSAGCGTSNASVDQNRMTGVADSGYPPKGSGYDAGSPAIKGNEAAGTMDRQAESLPPDVSAIPQVTTGTVGTTPVKMTAKRAGTLPPEPAPAATPGSDIPASRANTASPKKMGLPITKQ